LAGSPASWKVRGRKVTVVPGTPNIRMKEKFGDCQLHIERKTPLKDVGKVKRVRNPEIQVKYELFSHNASEFKITARFGRDMKEGENPTDINFNFRS
jgi:hypothetical protein